jgi:hypothetical protein
VLSVRGTLVPIVLFVVIACCFGSVVVLLVIILVTHFISIVDIFTVFAALLGRDAVTFYCCLPPASLLSPVKVVRP